MEHSSAATHLEPKDWIDFFGQIAVSITSLAAVIVALFIAHAQKQAEVNRRKAGDIVFIEALIWTANNSGGEVFWFGREIRTCKSAKEQVCTSEKALSGLDNFESALKRFDLTRFADPVPAAALIQLVGAVQRARGQIARYKEQPEKEGMPHFSFPVFDDYDLEASNSLEKFKAECNRLSGKEVYPPRRHDR